MSGKEKKIVIAATFNNSLGSFVGTPLGVLRVLLILDQTVRVNS